jgi:hypothetical protein
MADHEISDEVVNTGIMRVRDSYATTADVQREVVENAVQATSGRSWMKCEVLW